MSSIIRKTVLVVAILVAGYLAYDLLLVPRVLFFQSWEGHIAEAYRVFSYERAQQAAVLSHGRSEWEDYDYFWRVVDENGLERRIQIPIMHWAKAFETQKVTKHAFQRFPELGPVPEGAVSATELLKKEEDKVPVEDTEKLQNMALLGEAILLIDQPDKLYRELEIPPAGPEGEAPESFMVRFDCTTGSFVVEFRKEWSFHGAERVYELVLESFYNDCKFFRVIPNFAVQFGLPAQTMKGGQWVMRTIPDDPATMSNTRGMVSFAKSGPNSRSTQLFVNMGDNTRLDGEGFTPVGKVVAGMGTLELVNSEYGEEPNQSMIQSLGNEYLAKSFPNLSGVIRAVFVREDVRPPAPDTFQAVFDTDQGAFTVQFHRAWAPIGVDRVYYLINAGLYNDTRFFRVAPGALAQFGIPAKQNLSQAWHKAVIADDPVAETNRRGTFVLASAGPNTRAVQAFINLRDNPDYDALGYAPLGEVIQGVEVLDAINAEHGQEPEQARAINEANGYLDTFFPGLTNIRTVVLLPAIDSVNDVQEPDPASESASVPQDAVVTGQDAGV